MSAADISRHFAERTKMISTATAYRRERRVGDLAIAGAMAALLCLMALVYLLSPSPEGAASAAADPVWPALAILVTLTTARFAVAQRAPLPVWAAHAAIWIEFATLYALIACFQARYQQSPAFVLKSPTFVWAFVLIGLRALRFDPREVLAAGFAAALGWAALVVWVLRNEGPEIVTRDYVLYMGNPVVLIGAEVEKILALLAFSAALAFAMMRGERFLRRQFEASARLETALAAEQGLNETLNSEIAERRKTARALNDALYRDELTGLHSRKAFLTCVRDWRSAAPMTPFAIAIADIDRFRAFNDTFGRAAGDAVLRAVADRLKRALGETCLIARIGADEFAVLVPAATSTEQAGQFGKNLMRTLAMPIDADGRTFVGGANVGVAFGEAASVGDRIIANADLALNHAKALGRRRMALYNPMQRKAAAARAELEFEFRSAVKQSQLELVYQPIVKLADGAIVGWEALMRWRHPTRGDVSPADFIPLAEETGAIVEVGAWALRQAAHDAASFVAAGRPGHAFMSVNVSPVQLTAPKRLLAAFDEAVAAHPHIKLEITESAIVADPERALQVLDALKARGASLALDDFGTGASSLGQLRRFPFDTLKIDRSFILDAANADTTLLQAIIGMSRALRLATVAEGIESEIDAAALHVIGAQFGQGYWHGRPQTAKAVRESAAMPKLSRASDGARAVGSATAQ